MQRNNQRSGFGRRRGGRYDRFNNGESRQNGERNNSSEDRAEGRSESRSEVRSENRNEGRGFSQRREAGRGRFQNGPRRESGRSPQGRPKFCRAPKKTGVFDPQWCVKKASGQPLTEEYTPQHLFTDFGFEPELAANIGAHNYQKPTPIQDQTIPQIMAGRDVIGLANTGTGKTAAFLIPLINKVLKTKNKEQKVLIISPTRELAVQIKQEWEKFSANLGLRVILCIGGTNINSQLRQLEKPVNFIIGTPGRILDLANKNKLRLDEFSNIVLDEVDQMLDMGFIHDVRKIIAELAPQRQSLFFSATMTPAAQQIAEQFLREPLTISVKKTDTTANIDQDIIRLNGRSKNEVLTEILNADGCQKVLVFARTKHGADRIARNLLAQGFRVGAIHGNKSQNERLRVIDQFKQEKIHVLIATDVASRGLDIKNITHVINFDLPASYEDYIHRIGRTGRADQTGIALSLVE